VCSSGVVMAWQSVRRPNEPVGPFLFQLKGLLILENKLRKAHELKHRNQYMNGRFVILEMTWSSLLRSATEHLLLTLLLFKGYLDPIRL
jgi:hypothetical protein